MDEKARRRWWQFRLRTLLVVCALVAVPAAWFARTLTAVHERTELRSHMLVPIVCFVTNRSAEQKDTAGLPWLRRMLGDENVRDISLIDDTPAEIVTRIRKAFPEGTITFAHPGVAQLLPSEVP